MGFLGCTLLHNIQKICRQLPGYILYHSCVIGYVCLSVTYLSSFIQFLKTLLNYCLEL